jgi:hypothetical protein
MVRIVKGKKSTVIKLARPHKMPTAKQFLAHYFAMERPNTQHLFFSKGAVDFLLGIVIGIIIGVLIVLMVTAS